MPIPKWIYTDARAALVGAVVIAGITALWALLTGTMGIPAALIVAVSITAILGLAWNQWQQAIERDRRRRRANRSPSEIEHWVRDWLFKLKYQTRNDPNPEAHFQIVVTKSNGQNLTIVLPKAHPFVVIGARLVPDLSEKQKENNAILLAPDSTFHADLAVEFAQLGVDFRIETATGKLEVQIERKVTFDETITELGFAQEFLRVEGAINTTFAIANRVVIISKALKAKPLPPAARRDPKFP
jgi:hypothetical protein